MQQSIKRILAVAAIGAACIAPSLAQQKPPAGVAVAGSPSAELVEGEVRKVDKGTKRVTIRHGEIRSLDMPPMTMVFTVADASMLDQLKAGDKIRFRAADQGGGKLQLTEVQPAK